MTDKSLLQDFIAETGEHLEETEQNLMRLEQQPPINPHHQRLF